MGYKTSSGIRVPWKTYRIYRKFRFLKRRGTLFHKYPKSKHRYRKSNSWKYFHRAGFWFKKGAAFRLRRYRKQLAVSAKRLPHGYQTLGREQRETVPAPAGHGRTYSTGERIRRTYRRFRLVLRKRQRKHIIPVIPEAKGYSKMYVVYRKFRFLLLTGRLFRTDTGKLNRTFRKFLGHFGNPDNIIIFINSTVLFILAYLVVYLARAFTIAFTASSYGIPTRVLYYDLDYLIRASQWGQDSVTGVFSTGPFVCLLLFVLFLVIYLRILDEHWRIRLFFLWIFCHAFIQSFGEIMVGSLVNQGFGYVILYLGLLDTEKILVSFAAFIILLTVGFALRRMFLYSGNIYFNRLDSSNRLRFFLYQFIFPFLAGTFAIVLLKQPRMSGMDIAILATMSLLFLPLLLMGRMTNDLYYDEDPRKIRFFWWWLLAALILVPAFRIILEEGIKI